MNQKIKNFKQIAKAQTCEFRIMNMEGQVVHQFKCKNVIKLIYEEFKRYLLEAHPQNTIDYAAFHAHYKTVLGQPTTKRRHSLRDYYLVIWSCPPLYIDSDDEQKPNVKYKDNLAMKQILHNSLIYLYKVDLNKIKDGEITDFLIPLGRIGDKNFTLIQKNFTRLTGEEVKSKGAFNKYIQRALKASITDKLETYKNYVVLPVNLFPPLD